MNPITEKFYEFYNKLVWGLASEPWASGLSDRAVRNIIKTLMTVMVLCVVALITLGVVFVPNALAESGLESPTSSALTACLQDPATVWLAKNAEGNTVSVDVTNLTYPPQGGKLRIESALLFKSIYDELKAGNNPDAFYRTMIVAQADAWDADQNLASGELEMHVDVGYWRTFWDNAILEWGKDAAFVTADVLCVELPNKSQMSSVVAASLFNSIQDVIAKVPGFSAADFNPASSPVNQLVTQKVVELNCKNLRAPGALKTEAECVSNFAATTLSGQALVDAIKQFYANPTVGTASPTAIPTIAVTQYVDLNATQVAAFGQIYTNIVAQCGENDERCIGQQWDELAFTFSDNVIQQINDRCGDLDYCRGLTVLYRMQGYDENTAVEMAIQRMTEANAMQQLDECTWEEITANTCVSGAAMYYVYNEGGGVDTALALDAGGGVIDTVSSVTGVPYDTSRSHLVPIPTSSVLYGMYTDPYGNMGGGIIVSTNPLFSGSAYYHKTSSINGYDCYDKQPFYQQQAGAMWVYPSSIGRMEFCSAVIQPATPIPNNNTNVQEPQLPPLEAGLVAQGANMSSAIVLEFGCHQNMGGNYYFMGSGYNLSIDRSYGEFCGNARENTIYIATSAGKSVAGAGTGWTLLSGERNLYWAKRWP